MTDIRERIARALVRSYCDTEAEFDEQWADVEVTKHNAFLDAGRVIAALGIPPDRLEAVANGGAVIVPVEPTEAMLTAGHAEGVRANRTDNNDPLWIGMTHATALSFQSRYLPIAYRAMIAAAQEGKQT